MFAGFFVLPAVMDGLGAVGEQFDSGFGGFDFDF
jgi:hypothetical protein